MDYDWHDDRRARRMAPYRYRKTRRILNTLYRFTFTPAFLILLFASLFIVWTLTH